ncbi:MAG TPA: hypothetical protein VGM74_04955 [Burkholderiaceae bacterium]
MSAISMKTAGRIGLHALVAACASLALATSAQAQHGGGHGGGGHGFGGGTHVGPGFGHGHGHFGPGRGYGGYRGGPRYGWGGAGWGLGLGVGLGAAYYGWPYYGAYPYPYDPSYVVASPPMTDESDGSGGPPLIYPRNGQTTAQTNADSNACSQWAGAQPNATTDPSIFQRGFGACMDGRGYNIR